MEHGIDIAGGPLFAFTFLVMILGLGRVLLIQVYTLISGKGQRLKGAPWKRILTDSISWLFPVRHLIPGTVLFSSASFVFHVGAILVPLFLENHIVLWEEFLGLNLPSLGRGIADFLTLLTITCILLLLGCRIFVKRQRTMSQATDYVLLLIIASTFIFGFLASHPGINPIPWELAMLIHLLSADLMFVLIPFTKLAHVVTFAFDRISGVHWQLKPGAGERVAESLFGKEARV